MNKYLHKLKSRINKGFTLIELVVVVAIIAILSSVILYTTTQYIGKGKDSNIAGSLSVLIVAGESWYGGNGNSYSNFCDPKTNSVIENVISQMPVNINGYCYNSTTDKLLWGTSGNTAGNGNPAGICCKVDVTGQSWVAWAREFTTPANIYCVDSRGVKKDVTATTISSSKCP
jgi:prepilin-type N-terminal cleavage/methylation domain-containing protein